MTKRTKCRFCEYKRDFQPLADSNAVDKGWDNSGLAAYIVSGVLHVTGYYDGCVGIEPVETKINYCPMCGRKLEGDTQ